MLPAIGVSRFGASKVTLGKSPVPARSFWMGYQDITKASWNRIGTAPQSGVCCRGRGARVCVGLVVGYNPPPWTERGAGVAGVAPECNLLNCAFKITGGKL